MKHLRQSATPSLLRINWSHCIALHCFLLLLQDVLEFPNSLEGVLVLKKALDYEVDKEFKIAIRAKVTINLEKKKCA